MTVACGQAMVNLSDVPELMAGAQSRANPAARNRFERRCVELHWDECEDATHNPEEPARIHLAQNLAVMFPTVDFVLVQEIVAESQTEDQALETLLVLSGTDPCAGMSTLPRDPANDDESFPALVGSDGWEVPGIRSLELEGSSGVSWRERVGSAIEHSQPQRSQLRTAVPVLPRPPTSQKERVLDPEYETEYDCRQRQGQRRAENKAKYGRRQPDSKLSDNFSHVEQSDFVEDPSGAEFNRVLV